MLPLLLRHAQLCLGWLHLRCQSSLLLLLLCLTKMCVL
jgi:hypothetical protein